MKAEMGDPLGPPVIFHREDNPFGSTTYYGFASGQIFEVSNDVNKVMKSGYLASITLFMV